MESGDEDVGVEPEISLFTPLEDGGGVGGGDRGAPLESLSLFSLV